MIRLISTLIAALALGGATTQANVAQPRDSVAVVLSPGAAQRPGLIPALKGVPVRVPRTSAEQLAVNHLLAAQGVHTVVEVGVDRRVAVDPVARRYPGTRVDAVQADARASARAVGHARD
jgi:hypothetical protein